MYQDVTSETEKVLNKYRKSTEKVLKLIVTGIKYYKPSYIQAQALLIANHSPHACSKIFYWLSTTCSQQYIILILLFLTFLLIAEVAKKFSKVC